jgi:outer membrane protein TolC
MRFAALGILVTGCSHALPTIDGAPSAPPTRSEPWRAPAGVVPREVPSAATFTLPSDVAPRATTLMLADIVDVALRNNPQTQISWAQARAGAASYGAAAAAYIPSLDATANVARSQTTSQLGSSERSTLTPTLTLSYLLLDFGGRSGTISAARSAAVALDLTHNATIQNVALQAENAYFTYQAERSLLVASQLTLAEADTNLASARQRNAAGVATIADVLLAQTIQAQATLDLETVQGNVQIARAGVAVAMGLPANAPFQLAPVADSVPIAQAATSVDTLIDQALALRPDLAATRVQIQEARAQVRVARSAELPSVTLSSNFGKTLSNISAFQGLNYGLTLGVQIPIFNMARPYNVTAAEALVEAAAARSALLRTQVAQEVYSSYYLLQTATQRSRTSDVLLTSATTSEVVARERYRAGVGTIVDLITAQTALANARAQQAQARWTWAAALAQLSHDVGVIGPRGETLVPLSR